MVDANGAASTEHWSRAASCWTPSATCREERDKAGPLGRNQPAVVDVAADGLLRERVLELVVALEVCSEHPLARAILGGLLAGEPATLFVLPAIYSLIVRESARDVAERLRRQQSGGHGNGHEGHPLPEAGWEAGDHDA